MAEVSVTASTPTETEAAQLYQKELHHAVYYENFFQKYGFIGKSANSIIQLNEDFKKQKGDAINFNLRINPTAAPIADDGWIEGNEMAMGFEADSVLLGAASGALRSKGKVTEQSFVGDLRAEMRDGLADWWNRYYSTWIVKKLSGSTFQGYAGTAEGTLGSLTTIGEAASANTNILYGGDATSTDTLDASDTFTPDLIRRAKLAAKVGYIGSTQIHKIRPTVINAKPYFVLVAHDYQLYDLKSTDEWKQAMREAERRGPENPLFSGATAIWDGVVIYETDYVITASDWGAQGDVAGGTALFLGAQAGMLAIAQNGPDWVEMTRNYGRKWGVATGMVMGFDKSKFGVTDGGTAKDFAVIAIKTAAKNPEVING